MDVFDEMFGGKKPVDEDETNVVENTVEAPLVNAEAEVTEAPVETPVNVTEDNEEKIYDDKGHSVSLPVYLKTRDEVKELRRYKEQVEAERRAQVEEAARNQYVPNAESSPYEIAMWQQQQLHDAMLAERISTSMTFAEKEHGGELIAAAANWAVNRVRNSPDGAFFESQIESQRDPIGWVVREYQKDQKVNAVLTDEEAYFRANAQKYGFIPADNTSTQATGSVSTNVNNATTQPKTTKLPGSSINSLTSAAGAREAGAMDAIDSLFKK